MHEIDTFTEDGWSVTLYADEDAGFCNPRDNDNLGTLACSHKRYVLGDTHATFDASDYSGWDEVRDMLTESHGPLAIMEPVYMLDHSGTALSLTAFNDRWDSGQVGWCFVTVKQMQTEYGKEWRDRLSAAREIIAGELAEYSRWCNGEVYGYVVRNADGDEADSCWGFIGWDYAVSEAKGAMHSARVAHMEAERELDALIGRGFAL